MGQTLSASRRSWTIGTLYLLVFANSLGKTVILLFVAILLFDRNSPFLPEQTSEAARYLLYGLLIGASAAVELVITPFVGAISDRYGRRAILLVTTLSGILGYVLCVFGSYLFSVPLLMLGRAVSGLSTANVSISMACITDLTTPQNRGRYMSIISICQGFGWGVGPPIGAYLADPTLFPGAGPAIPFILMVALLGLGWLLLLSAAETVTPNRAPLNLGDLYSAFQATFRVRGVGTLFLICGVMVIGVVLYVHFFGLYLTERFEMTPQRITLVFLYLAFWRLVGGFLANLLFKYFPARQLATIPMWVLAAACLVVLLPLSPVHLYWIVPLAALSATIVTACFFTLFGDAAHPDMRGKTFAGVQSLLAFAFLAVPFVAVGLAVAWLDLPNLLGGVLMLGATLWYMRAVAPKRFSGSR
ncbi:MAG: MFS transporter [Parachlamydiales bacterium]